MAQSEPTAQSHVNRRLLDYVKFLNELGSTAVLYYILYRVVETLLTVMLKLLDAKCFT